MLSPDLPEPIGVDKLLEVLGGYGVQLFHQAQHPDYFLCLFTAESIKELLNRTVTGPGPVEVDLTHLKRLTQT